ncbi:hypothetical protein [Salinibaculum rarum]|uniref:hypothetical protein n=1 Tax=Salinibaculum rarum TaxID=3058903 RepID=UPI00265E4D9D|nr:hypothetical protein [Salinibaculum sp. KK48]
MNRMSSPEPAVPVGTPSVRERRRRIDASERSVLVGVTDDTTARSQRFASDDTAFEPQLGPNNWAVSEQ